MGACSSSDDGDSVPKGTMRFVDQSGAEFYWVCQEDGADCEVHRIAGVSPPLPECEEDETPEVGHRGAGRFFTAYTACRYPDGLIWFGRDRIAVCEQDDDCPQRIDDDYEFECRHGFCQDTDLERSPPGEVDRTEAFELCFGHLPRPTELGVYAYIEVPEEQRDEVNSGCNPGNVTAPCESIPSSCPDPG